MGRSALQHRGCSDQGSNDLAHRSETPRAVVERGDAGRPAVPGPARPRRVDRDRRRVRHQAARRRRRRRGRRRAAGRRPAPPAHVGGHAARRRARTACCSATCGPSTRSTLADAGRALALAAGRRRGDRARTSPAPAMGPDLSPTDGSPPTPAWRRVGQPVGHRGTRGPTARRPSSPCRRRAARRRAAACPTGRRSRPAVRCVEWLTGVVRRGRCRDRLAATPAAADTASTSTSPCSRSPRSASTGPTTRSPASGTRASNRRGRSRSRPSRPPPTARSGSAPRPAQQWADFCVVIGRPDLAEDATLRTGRRPLGAARRDRRRHRRRHRRPHRSTR